jgi:hypothetical protein
VDLRHYPGERRRDLRRSLVGDDLDQWGIFFDRVAFRDEPLVDLGFRYSFAEIGQLEIRHDWVDS